MNTTIILSLPLLSSRRMPSSLHGCALLDIGSACSTAPAEVGTACGTIKLPLFATRGRRILAGGSTVPRSSDAMCLCSTFDKGQSMKNECYNYMEPMEPHLYPVLLQHESCSTTCGTMWYHMEPSAQTSPCATHALAALTLNFLMIDKNLICTSCDEVNGRWVDQQKHSRVVSEHTRQDEKPGINLNLTLNLWRT